MSLVVGVSPWARVDMFLARLNILYPTNLHIRKNKGIKMAHFKEYDKKQVRINMLKPLF